MLIRTSARDVNGDLCESPLPKQRRPFPSDFGRKIAGLCRGGSSSEVLLSGMAVGSGCGSARVCAKMAGSVEMLK